MLKRIMGLIQCGCQYHAMITIISLKYQLITSTFSQEEKRSTKQGDVEGGECKDDKPYLGGWCSTMWNKKLRIHNERGAAEATKKQMTDRTRSCEKCCEL